MHITGGFHWWSVSWNRERTQNAVINFKPIKQHPVIKRKVLITLTSLYFGFYLSCCKTICHILLLSSQIQKCLLNKPKCAISCSACENILVKKSSSYCKGKLSPYAVYYTKSFPILYTASRIKNNPYCCIKFFLGQQCRKKLFKGSCSSIA